MKEILFSICIPVRNDPGNLRQCLRGFRNQDLFDCEILVCDDGSTPPLSASDFADAGVEFTLVRQVGQGPSVARNHLARLARGRYLFFVDADTVPRPGLLKSARQVIAGYPHLQVFYGSYDDEPAHPSLVSSYKNLLHHYTHHAAGKTGKVTTFWCGCGVVRRELYLQFGGLSEFYTRPSIEDIELGSRLSGHGVEIQVFPELQVKHLKKWTMSSWLRTDVFQRAIPWLRLMRATKEWTPQLNFSWSQRIACLAAVTLIACIPLTVLDSRFALAGLVAFLVFLGPNFPFFDLVRRKRGLAMSIAVIPLHLIYAFICVASAGAVFLYPPLKIPPQAVEPRFPR